MANSWLCLHSHSLIGDVHKESVLDKGGLQDTSELVVIGIGMVLYQSFTKLDHSVVCAVFFCPYMQYVVFAFNWPGACRFKGCCMDEEEQEATADIVGEL